MRKSFLPVIAVRPLDCGHIETAHQRIKEMQPNRPHDPEPPTVFELEEALGERVHKCKLWKSNWRNRIYRLELASGVAVAKQLLTGNSAKLQCEFDQLRLLARLEIPGLRVPKALALLPTKRAYVMESAPGKTIRGMLWNGSNGDDTLQACDLAGKILARIHIAWTQSIRPIPVELLARDLAAAHWHLSLSQRKILQSAFRSLAKVEVSIGQIYGDYNPANLLFKDGELYLIDPPSVVRRGVQLWDFSCFRSSMRRESWRLNLWRPFGRHAGMIKQSVAAFERGYLGSLNEGDSARTLFTLAARLFDLHRTAVLITLEKGKIDIARKKMSVAGAYHLGYSLTNRVSLFLLKMEKCWLFRQLARELPGYGPRALCWLVLGVDLDLTYPPPA